MSDLTAGLRKALTYYGSVVGAARAGQTTAEVWDTLRSAAAAAGQTLSGISVSQISTLRGFAGRQLAADAALTAAPFGSTIDSAMLSIAPYARDPASMNAAPEFYVNIELGTLRNGEFGTTSYTVRFTGSLPPTTDQLLNELQGAAADFGNQYGFTAGDILSVSIVQV